MAKSVVFRVWGTGVSQGKRVSKRKRPFSVGVVYGDIHDPYCDEPAFEMVLDALTCIKPDFVVENGDGFNSDGFAMFVKYPDVKM